MKSNIPSLLVVGAGLFGLTIADRVARTLGRKVHVIDAREHIGGNAHSYKEESTGIEVHKYGSHLFHTSHEEVWKYVNEFSEFNDYRHSVVSLHNGTYFPMPINLQTISLLFGKAMSPSEAAQAIKHDVETHRDGFKQVEETFESRALSTIGPKLYQALIQGYTMKQWQTSPDKLPSAVFSRLPVRFDHSNGYFTDRWQGLPLNGYSTMFDRMADDPRISIELGTDFFKSPWMNNVDTPTVFTGPIDKYFNYRHGRLSWRTLDFETEVMEVDDFQGTSVVNYPDQDFRFTRIHEFKHLHPERKHTPGLTVISKEYSRWAEREDEPYYPVNSPADREKLIQYRHEARKLKNTYFGGRLGTYQYLDMHMAIASALVMFENEIRPRLEIS